MNPIELNNKTLNVTIAPPGSAYRRSRFDWTGMVSQVRLGDRTFLGRESDGNYRGTEGFGLATEFGIETPLSYGRTFPGREFMKIGVGALKRTSIRPYNFMKDYPVRPFQTDVQVSEDRAVFTQSGISAGPYRCDYMKAISIKENELTIGYRLVNSGTRTIRTEEYCHNFLRPSGRDITGRLEIRTNRDLSAEKTVGELNVEKGKITFPRDPEGVFFMYGLLKENPEDFSWSITDRETGASVTGAEGFPVSRFALWGMKHVISPETYHSFSLPPGEELHWKRTLIFLD